MNSQTQVMSDLELPLSEPVCRIRSFAALLRQSLGEPAWARLEPAITARFSPYISDKRPLVFRGNMHWVYCSPVGMLIATVLGRFSILPRHCVRSSEFEFTIGVNGNAINKKRAYDMKQKGLFVFCSTFNETPRLHEEFGGGIGMYLQLAEKRRALLFRDRGYFLRLWQWRIPIPTWLTVGRFDLLHRNINERRFQIIIRVAHPLFGTLFYQRGEFEKVELYP